MNAKEFWDRLEFRLCREIEGLRASELRGFWCDGFDPDAFESTDGKSSITGRVWMMAGQVSDGQWRFTLLLPVDVHDESEIDWASLLPADDVTGWLSVDRDRRQLYVNPAVADPDTSA